MKWASSRAMRREQVVADLRVGLLVAGRRSALLARVRGHPPPRSHAVLAQPTVRFLWGCSTPLAVHAQWLGAVPWQAAAQ